MEKALHFNLFNHSFSFKVKKNAKLTPSCASFVKVNETDYLIFGLPYKANQILEISPSGQQTLDGNKEFYFQKQYKFDHKNNANGYIAKEFKNFHKINKDITKCLLVPVQYEGLYTKTTDMVLPKTYNFSNPNMSCDVLCLPFFGNTAANSGVFVFDRGSVRNRFPNVLKHGKQKQPRQRGVLLRCTLATMEAWDSMWALCRSSLSAILSRIYSFLLYLRFLYGSGVAGHHLSLFPFHNTPIFYCRGPSWALP